MILKTAHKVAIATVASTCVRLARRLAGRGPVAEVVRHGVRWRLDLREGIDFSIYLLGAFEPGTMRAYEGLVKEGQVVLDIGANIGAHTLPLARLVGARGRVVAFEPTAFAFRKLEENVALNPDLAPRVARFQSMLVDRQSESLPATLFSSWPLGGTGDVHAKHRGKSMTTEGASAVRLDDAVRELGLTAIDFIKLDVDGHELPVLRGGVEAIGRFRPLVLIELSPYVHTEEGHDFDDVVAFFRDLGYRFRDADSGHDLPVDAAKLRAIIPDGGGLNAVAFASP